MLLTRVSLGLALFATAEQAGAIQRWVFCNQNLWVDQNITNLIALMQRASTAGYTHMLLGDSKFSRLGTMDAHYFQNVNKVKQAATQLHLEIVPAVFPIGYSNDLLFNDPNLIEGMPATNALLIVSNGVARIQSDLPVAFPNGDFSNLARWSWKDSTVVADNGTARVTNPNGANARIVQQFTVKPFRQYHISVQIKTQNFPAAPSVAVISSSGQSLNFNSLGVQATQDWTTHHAVFNSLGNTQVNVYFGVWGGTTGTLWWDNAFIEEVAFLNLIRRPGAPLTVRIENGATLVEGRDFTPLTDPLMGALPWPGSYDIYHASPLLRAPLPDGTRLRAGWTHAVTVNDDQANICPSEPATVALLEDQTRRMHAAWNARSYFMSHDEIRVLNWCPACQARQLTAGQVLADNVRTCAAILRSVNPGGQIYVWSDMFDPNHNAHANYYLVRGDLTGSWLGLDPDIIIVPWDYDQRAASLKFFAGLGNRQLIAGYYDTDPTLILNWLAAGRPYPGIVGAMYTSWVPQYGDLETFSQLVAGYAAPDLWFAPRLGLSVGPAGTVLSFAGEKGQPYRLDASTNLPSWIPWTNFTSGDWTLTLTNPPPVAGPAFYRAAYTP